MAGRRRKHPPKAAPTPRREPRDLSLPLEALAWQVGEEEHGQRLDRFLLPRLRWRSRSSIVEELISGQQVLRNGEPLTRKAARLQRGDTVEVLVPPPEQPDRHAALAEELAAAILYEDEDLLVLSKPAGLVVHPVGRIRSDTLIQALHWLYLRGSRAQPGVLPRICHRLDRETSGVIVVAKTFPARSRLQSAFEGHEVVKEYLAVVRGVPAAAAGTIDLPIGPDEGAPVELMMTTRPDGAPARTHWELLEALGEASLVRFRLETGRQHQIRVHARALGHPVLLDPLYGDGRLAWPEEEGAVIRRLALHAHRLELPHPRTGAPLRCEAPLPADLEALLAGLRRAAGA